MFVLFLLKTGLLDIITKDFHAPNFLYLGQADPEGPPV